ncbi:MAG: cob(I)alamin adenosyltransferase [Clostridiales bacterium]|nr:cob(I)alamin adenosyltransferase [Clostridiales bacterium]
MIGKWYWIFCDKGAILDTVFSRGLENEEVAMSKEVHAFYGNGLGKTSAAIGQCIKEASMGHQVIVIQFLKGKDIDELNFLSKMEPQIKLFRFEKENECFSNLSKEVQEEEKRNIRNGFNFAKKVVETGECDLLVLDEVLGLVDYDIITLEDIIHLLQYQNENHKIILTGSHLPEPLFDYVTTASEIRQIK